MAEFTKPRKHYDTSTECECPLAQEWDEYRDRGLEAMNQIAEIHKAIGDVAGHTAYLKRLDPMAMTLRLFVIMVFGIFVCVALITGKNFLFDTNGIHVIDPAPSKIKTE